jgi:hypothetical protein
MNRLWVDSDCRYSQVCGFVESRFFSQLANGTVDEAGIHEWRAVWSRAHSDEASRAEKGHSTNNTI